MRDKLETQVHTALALAHFAATAAATLTAALHRGRPVDDAMVTHLLQALASGKAVSPNEADSYFDKIAEVLAGKHYEA